jgi:ABC-2 type transport system permease protein
MLLTLPISVSQAVLGKFFAAWAFLGIALLMTFPIPVAVYYLGQPDTGLIITGYLGSFLLAGSFLAIGSFFSALTKNQVISFILSVVACGILVYAGMPTTVNYLSSILPTGAVQIVQSLSIQSHLDSVLKGVIEFKDMAYFVILIVAWISACAVILEERKAA